MLIIDAHSHLWLKQDTVVDGQPIHSLDSNPSRSLFFGEERQMLPPFMIDGRNTAEVFLSNMDYAQVGGAVVVQEVIDGNQNDYLEEVQRRYPERFFCMGMASSLDEAQKVYEKGLRGIAIPGHRIKTPLTDLIPMFEYMQEKSMILSLCLHEDNHQLREVDEIVRACPDLIIAIGHFGMVTTPNWMDQVRLARHKNVYVESGGITWLFNSEFYPYPSAMQAIRQAADEVGIEKLMWGSDYPRTITAITYRMSYDFVIKSEVLTDSEKEAFLGGNAKRLYGFDRIPELPYIKNMSE
ncbi:MAG: amidohydrolase [Bacteroidales bacterium]|nr:amidohydrolase [Bacteroidales bacterium]